MASEDSKQFVTKKILVWIASITSILATINIVLIYQMTQIQTSEQNLLTPKLEKEIIDIAQREFARVAEESLSLASNAYNAKTAAARAYEEASKQLKEDNIDLAKVYCLNAINHAPYEKLYYEKLFEIQKASKAESSLNELEQIYNMLELGVYQVNYDNIIDMQKMMLELNQQREKLINSVAEQEGKHAEANTQESLAIVDFGTLSWGNLAKIENFDECILKAQERLNILNELFNLSGLPIRKHEWISDEIEKTVALKEYTAGLIMINNLLNNAERLLAESNRDSFISIKSIMAATNNFYNQILSIELSKLPSNALGRLTELGTKINTIEDKFQIASSTLSPIRSEIDKIDQRIMQFKSNGNKSCSNQIKDIREQAKKMAALLSETPNKILHEIVNKKLENYAQMISEYEIKRYKEYQRWAVTKLGEAFKLYHSWNRVDEVDAIKIINTYLLEIDISLLTPEVARLYQRILDKQYVELGKETLVEWEINLAKSEKKTLENF